MSLVGVHRFTMLARVFTGLQSRSLHLAASKNVSGNWVVVNAHRHQRYRNWQPVIAATLVRHASDAAPKGKRSPLNTFFAFLSIIYHCKQSLETVFGYNAN
uniref:Secreted protein n=1 Tax=Trichogramma kaykai TaxID=54128 RepID=A0ABD2XGI1_9HYME